MTGLSDPLGGSQHTNAADVTDLFQAAAGNFANGFAGPDLVAPPSYGPVVHGGADPLVSIPTVSANAGGSVSVPINIDNAHPAGSTGLAEAVLVVKFDSSALSVGSVSVGSVTAGFDVESSVDGGTLTIRLSSSQPVINTAGGSLVVINFQVNPGASGHSPINLAAGTELYDTNGLLTLNPQPTDGADPIDGAIDAVFGG